MNIILLSGGSGKRLWPLSNDIRSKQFIKFFRDENGKYQSMLQKIYSQIRTVDKNAEITITASKMQVSSIHNQIGNDVNICVEPSRKDTFPAIALAASYLAYVKKVSLDESIIVCPVDPYVDEEYFVSLKEIAGIANSGEQNLTLMGVEPTYPSEKYGYIIPANKEHVSPVSMFKEKPDKEAAEKYIADGALWNSGVFAFKLKYILQKSHEILDFKDYNDLYIKYNQVESISFDYAVVEKEEKIAVMRFGGEWKDLGTWNTLTEAMHENSIGNVVMNQKCNNVHVINELDVPILCMGLKDVVVSASPDGILVSDKGQSSYIKPYVDKFEGPVMYAEKSWGMYCVIDVSSESMTIKIVLKAGSRMNYHSHERRDEIWNIISGCGKVIVDGMKKVVKAGDVVTMEAGCRHTIIAETELKIIEVQLGKDISVADKKKYKLEE
ncbi:cupin domain-containing protein [Eubacterium sp. MSJ-13]|uniref:sugar phosphate nucleotidyltransferase n=1 Tax=Eubacterium sp. MSJ-13 TaxID=2841513 RepID=UPI001C0F6990|nr:sugar phosphate nucleotidyltransferase [Eubacterium sp. MSJ-13]MBU5477613.1 cupin domain-containing protein [Eubacterium sp. MSJ-13]